MNNEMNQGGSVLLDLVEKYNSTNEEIYFKQLWEEVKAFSIMIAKKYHDIPFEDKISIAQECLWKCCSYLKPGANLLTLFGTSLNNKYYDIWAKKMQRDNYKMNANAYSIDKMNEDFNYEPVDNTQEFNIEMFIYECKLSQLESELCLLIHNGYRQSEIMKKMNIKNNQQYMKLKNTMREKIRINYLSEGLTI